MEDKNLNEQEWSFADMSTTNSDIVPKRKISKKKLGIIIGVVAIIAIACVIVFIPDKFDRVEEECVEIAGLVTKGDENSFTIETKPDICDETDPTSRYYWQERALEAIKYANEKLGFSGVYSQMLNTNSLMGRQSEENSKYKVTWTYHPDDGLTVTYIKK